MVPVYDTVFVLNIDETFFYHFLVQKKTFWSRVFSWMVEIVLFDIQTIFMSLARHTTNLLDFRLQTLSIQYEKRLRIFLWSCSLLNTLCRNGHIVRNHSCLRLLQRKMHSPVCRLFYRATYVLIRKQMAGQVPGEWRHKYLALHGNRSFR